MKIIILQYLENTNFQNQRSLINWSLFSFEWINFCCHSDYSFNLIFETPCINNYQKEFYWNRTSSLRYWKQSRFWEPYNEKFDNYFNDCKFHFRQKTWIYLKRFYIDIVQTKYSKNLARIIKMLLYNGSSIWNEQVNTYLCFNQFCKLSSRISPLELTWRKFSHFFYVQYSI